MSTALEAPDKTNPTEKMKLLPSVRTMESMVPRMGVMRGAEKEGNMKSKENNILSVLGFNF